MKRAIFICLLSLSMCLSQPTEKKDVDNGNVPAVDPKATLQAAKVPEHPAEPAHLNPTDTKTPVDTKPTEKPQVPPATNATTIPEPKPADNKTVDNNTKKEDTKVTPPHDAAKDDKNAKADPAKKDGADVKPDPAKPDPAKVDPAKKAANDTNHEEAKPGKPTEPTKPANEPAKATDDVHLQARGFDGPSFIGGIILTLGMLAIGFMGFKYYKNQTERNYHTL